MVCEVLNGFVDVFCGLDLGRSVDFFGEDVSEGFPVRDWNGSGFRCEIWRSGCGTEDNREVI